MPRKGSVPCLLQHRVQPAALAHQLTPLHCDDVHSTDATCHDIRRLQRPLQSLRRANAAESLAPFVASRLFPAAAAAARTSGVHLLRAHLRVNVMASMCLVHAPYMHSSSKFHFTLLCLRKCLGETHITKMQLSEEPLVLLQAGYQGYRLLRKFSYRERH